MVFSQKVLWEKSSFFYKFIKISNKDIVANQVQWDKTHISRFAQ